MRTLFSWLHLADLSDLGSRLRVSDPDAVLDRLREDAVRLSKQAVAPDAIIVTGDLAHDGRDYWYAGAFLWKLAADLGLSSADVFIVPGNHDVDLTADRDRAVARLIRSLKAGEDSLDDSLRSDVDRALLERRFEGYSRFASGFGSGGGLYWSHRREVRGTAVRLVGMNTELLFTGREDGVLRVGHEQLSLLDVPSGELVIALSHHPFDEGYVQDANPARVASANHAHVHLVSASYVEGRVIDIINVAAGGRPRDSANRGFSYNLAAVMSTPDGMLTLRAWPRQWSPIKEDFRIDADEVPDGATLVDTPIPGREDGRAILKPHLIWPSTPGGEELEAPSTPRHGSDGDTVEYVASLSLNAIRAIRHVEWTIPAAPGWHVVIGDNGSGKTTFLRALAIALLTNLNGSDGANDQVASLPVNATSWVGDVGEIDVQTQCSLLEEPDVQMAVTTSIHHGRSDVGWNGALRALGISFSAGFGPFRRFTGGDPDYEREFASKPRAARHLSLFTERIAMTECIRWLKDLQFKALEDKSNAAFLDSVKSFINSDYLLPNGVRLDKITSDAVTFRDANGCRVSLEDLSDGYRSILSLTIELVRQLAAHYGHARIFNEDRTAIAAPGIVLIDEVDAHLHPTWQREIGIRLRALFPKIQFIVTTHSPLVCHGAADRHGSVFRLPRPGTDEQGTMLAGIELDRILYGNVLDAYGTGAFGDIQRSEEGMKKLARLSELNQKELDTGLSPEEVEEQDKLRAIFPTARARG